MCLQKRVACEQLAYDIQAYNAYINNLNRLDVVQRPCFANAECAILISLDFQESNSTLFLYRHLGITLAWRCTR